MVVWMKKIILNAERIGRELKKNRPGINFWVCFFVETNDQDICTEIYSELYKQLMVL